MVVNALLYGNDCGCAFRFNDSCSDDILLSRYVVSIQTRGQSRPVVRYHHMETQVVCLTEWTVIFHLIW